ncbi:aldo/keto reductase [Sphingosinicellaceae bacterium]|nr:aldo/keto reductase [Sphingosinicellaceae bacterium]
MRYNRLGQTGLFVSELCLGCMTFGGESGMWKTIGDLDQSGSETLVKAALDAGVNFLDTADVYGSGRSEEITGQALKNLGINRQEIVVATKAHGEMHPGPNGRGASRYHLIDACKASLKRLQLDHIDLYQIHGFDPATPMEETLRALETLVQHGHVRYVGVSNWAAWQVTKALGISERLGTPRLASIQSYYSVVGRDLERDIVPMLASENVGLMVWSPLAGGFLSGKYTRGDDGEVAGEGRRNGFSFPPTGGEKGFAVVEAMRPIAASLGVPVAQVALAWLLAQPQVTSVIIGAKRPEQLADNLAAVDVTLTPEHLATLEAASALEVEYPGWMIDRLGEFRRGLLAGSK